MRRVLLQMQLNGGTETHLLCTGEGRRVRNVWQMFHFYANRQNRRAIAAEEEERLKKKEKKRESFVLVRGNKSTFALSFEHFIIPLLKN